MWRFLDIYNVSTGIFFTGIFFTIKRLIFNVPLMLFFVGATAEVGIDVITQTFQVKYYQTQFGTSPATAAQLMGALFLLLFFKME